MAEVTLLIHDLAAAVTPVGTGPLRGREFGALRVHSPASVAIAGDRIFAVGQPAEILREIPSGRDYESVDGRGKVALPGLVDCHTHPAFLGDRAAEFGLRSSRATYEEIHASGGGIRSTVAATRAGGERDLRSSVERHLGWMLEHGTTTAEAKSGYGLDRETELKSLRAIDEAGRSRPVDVVPTFLGAHTVPPAFDSAADHLEATKDEGALLLAKSDVAAVLLPACGLFLDLPLPPARLLADEGAIVALATDF